MSILKKIGQQGLISMLLLLFTFSFMSCNQGLVDPASTIQNNREVNSNVTTRNLSPLSNDDDWVTSTNIYQVYVDKFANDLDGVTAKIDYLERIGVKTIWLMPIFEAMNNHGYDASDYYSIESRYGTEQDLYELVQAAHAADIRVILDLVVNHCGTDHEWFSSPDPNVRKDDWFIWKDSDWGWDDSWSNTARGYYPGRTFFKDPYDWYDRDGNGNNHDDDYYFALFGDSNACTMPDLNFNNAQSRTEIVDEIENIMRYWIGNTGIDGFRCDAVRYLVEEGQGKQKDRNVTHEIWQDINTRLKSFAPGAILLAEAPTENWDQMLGYYGYDYWPNDSTDDPNDGYINLNNFTPEFDAAFHFGYQGTLMAAAKDSWWPSNLFKDLYAIQSHLPNGTQDAIFLSNHDRFAGDRVATQLDNNQAKMKMAASLYLTLSGAPTIYYGEEYGIQNGSGSGDDPIRTQMDWNIVDNQEADPSSMVNHYRRILSLRNHYDALRGGITYFVPTYDGSGWNSIESGGKIASYIREWYGEKVLVVHNFSDQTLNAHVDLTAAGAITTETDVNIIMGGSGNYPNANSSNDNWYDVGSFPGKTSKMFLIGDISKYVVPALGTFLTYENAIDGEIENSWYFRGTPNSWGVAKMDYNSTTGLYETIQYFNGGDSAGGPRFKISASSDPANWNNAYPANDYPVPNVAGNYLIQFRESDKSVLEPVYQGGGNDDLIIHYREWEPATTYYVHTWNGLSSDYSMNYEGEFSSGKHWWKTTINSVPNTFSFCFKNSNPNNNWDGVNRHYIKSVHGNEIYIIHGDPNIYTSRQ